MPEAFPLAMEDGKPEKRSSECRNPPAAASSSAAGAREKGGETPAHEILHHSQQQQFPNSKPRTPLQPLAITKRSLDEWPQPSIDDSSDCTIPATPGYNRKMKNAADMKLDLASVRHASAEPTEIQLKRDKLAHFDKECSRVADHIYLGSDAVAKNRETLRANGITHVLNCVGFVCPEYFKRDLVYQTLWLQDSPSEDITSLLYDVFDYFEEVKEQGGRVFVHCCQGVSRSTSLVIAYLMWREGRSFEDAFHDVKTARGVTNPNMGFACQLLQCQKCLHAVPMSPNSLLRMYRIAPHSPYDPLHLVPKAVSSPGAAALDSRGAFVIHVPLAIYVWIGQNCHPRMAQAAKGAARQVVRYERAQGPVMDAKEGQETPEFWESMCKYLVSTDGWKNEGESMEEANMDDGQLQLDSVWEKDKENGKGKACHLEVERVKKLHAGAKKVSLYDDDFELYQRARQGGVVPPLPSTGIGLASVPTRIPAREDGWSVLRRQFLSGKLIPPKDTSRIDKPYSNSLSPHSMDPSSPYSYPFLCSNVSPHTLQDNL